MGHEVLNPAGFEDYTVFEQRRLVLRRQQQQQGSAEEEGGREEEAVGSIRQLRRLKRDVAVRMDSSSVRRGVRGKDHDLESLAMLTHILTQHSSRTVRGTHTPSKRHATDTGCWDRVGRSRH